MINYDPKTFSSRHFVNTVVINSVLSIQGGADIRDNQMFIFILIKCHMPDRCPLGQNVEVLLQPQHIIIRIHSSINYNIISI